MNQRVRKPKTPIEISDKTHNMLREYCRLNNIQIRSVVDDLLQDAITTRLKAVV